ncbi:MAG: hypothetical protein AAF502_22890 [Bacteroidota bacterium]
MDNILKSIFLILLMSISAASFAQKETWSTLAKVSFKREFDEMMGLEVETPVYSQTVLELQGTEIAIEGYFIPLKGKKAQSHFMLSAYPYKMCYFCGAAGPESVAQVFMKDSKEVEYTSKTIKLKGRLTLGFGDVNNLMYTISNAVLIE